MAMVNIARQKASTHFSMNLYHSSDVLRFPFSLPGSAFSNTFTSSRVKDKYTVKMDFGKITLAKYSQLSLETTSIKKLSTVGMPCLHVRRITSMLAGEANSSRASSPSCHRWTNSARTFSSKPIGQGRRRVRPPSPIKMRHLLSRPMKKLSHGQAKSGGRHTATGQITAYHRGGGTKRLQRVIDKHRSHSAVGVVERVEYDPTRSSRIALVRWMEGVPQPWLPKEVHTSKPPVFLRRGTTPVQSQFSLAALPGKVYGVRPPSYTNEIKAQHALIGLPPRVRGQKCHIITEYRTYKYNNIRDVFLDAFSRKKPEGGKVFNFPRVAVAGKPPAFYSPQRKGAEPGSPRRIIAWKTPELKRREPLCWKNSRARGTVMRA